MEIVNWINAGIVILGLPLILRSVLYVGRRLQVLDELEGLVRNQVLPKLSEIDKRLSIVEVKLDVMWDWFSKNIIANDSIAKSGN